MLAEIVGNYLDNGLNLRSAIHDTFELKKNTRQLPRNIKTYQSLVDSKIGLLIEESEVFMECNIDVKLFEKDTITSFSLWEGSHSFNRSTVIIEQEQSKQSYFANYFKGYLHNLKNGRIILLDKENIIQQLPPLMNQQWNGNYGDLSVALKNLTTDINDYLKF